MHDLDRKDLVLETEDFDLGSAEFEDDELGLDQSEGVFDEEEQSELAAELLGVGDDQELDHFLSGLIRRAKSKLRPFSKMLGNQVGGLLKGAAKRALPSLAQLAGGALGGPVGAALASKATPMLSSIFGMELEGLSPEDQEFEAAKQFVRLAGATLQNAASAGAGAAAAPVRAAQQALVDAARQHAPGLVRAAASATGARRDRGTWIRRGNRIVLLGI